MIFDRVAVASSIIPIFRRIMGGEDYLLIQAPFDQDSPAEAYGTLQIFNNIRINHAEELEITSLGQRIKYDIDFSVRVTAFGKGANQAVQTLKQKLEFPSVTDKLTAVNVVWRGDADVIDLTEVINTKYQERAVLNLTLGSLVESYDEDVLPIEKVTVNQTLINEDDSTVETSIESVATDITLSS